jgi:hypothetical protein
MSFMSFGILLFLMRSASIFGVQKHVSSTFQSSMVKLISLAWGVSVSKRLFVEEFEL